MFISLWLCLAVHAPDFVHARVDDTCPETYLGQGEGAEVNSLHLMSDGTFTCWVPNRDMHLLLEKMAAERKSGPAPAVCGNALENYFSGKWKKNDSRLELEFAFDRSTEPHPPVATQWMRIPWDERQYLVPEGRIVDFCNEVNFGFEPRPTPEGRFLLRAGDHDKRARGWPTLAEEWRSFLLLEPIQGKLERIDEDGFGHLDIGEDQGLRAGMVLLVYGDGQMRSWRLKVLCPCGPSARVEIIEPPRLGESRPRDVVPGDMVTTKAR